MAGDPRAGGPALGHMPPLVWAGTVLGRRTPSTQGTAVGCWPAVDQVRRDGTWGSSRRGLEAEQRPGTGAAGPGPAAV